MKGGTGNDGKEPGISMMTGAAGGRAEMPGALSELSGRKPQLAGNGAANISLRFGCDLGSDRKRR